MRFVSDIFYQRKKNSNFFILKTGKEEKKGNIKPNCEQVDEKLKLMNWIFCFVELYKQKLFVFQKLKKINTTKLLFEYFASQPTGVTWIVCCISVVDGKSFQTDLKNQKEFSLSLFIVLKLNAMWKQTIFINVVGKEKIYATWFYLYVEEKINVDLS